MDLSVSQVFGVWMMAALLGVVATMWWKYR